MVGELEGAGSVNVLTIIRGGSWGSENIIMRVGTPTGDEIGHIIIILRGGRGDGVPSPRALKQNIIIILGGGGYPFQPPGKS